MLNQTQVCYLLKEVTLTFDHKKEYLSELDAQVGDGDHGFSIARGCKAGLKAIEEIRKEATTSRYFQAYGRALTCEVGGAMGPLFGLIFTEIGTAIEDDTSFSVADLKTGLVQARKEICELGGAKPGDKTMVDAIVPAVVTMEQATKEGLSEEECMAAAVDAAKQGVESTIPMVARRGRSKYLRERSAGHQDAGATSFYTLLTVFQDAFRSEQ